MGMQHRYSGRHSFFFFFFFSSFFSSPSSSSSSELLLLSESESLLESLLLESEKGHELVNYQIKIKPPDDESSFFDFFASSFTVSVFLFITVVLLSRCTYLQTRSVSVKVNDRV